MEWRIEENYDEPSKHETTQEIQHPRAELLRTTSFPHHAAPLEVDKVVPGDVGVLMAVMCSQNLIALIHELSNVFALSSSIEILSRSVRRSLHCNVVCGGGDEWKSRIGYCGFHKSH